MVEVCHSPSNPIGYSSRCNALSRFFTAIFLHAGLVHLALNMLGQWTLCGQVEQEMGSPSFLILYLASGLFGNVLGGNFALVGIPSASTLIYYNW